MFKGWALWSLRKGRSRAALVCALLAFLSWPKEAWLSGAMSASGVSRSYAISVSEYSYAFGVDPPPSAEYMEAEARSWRMRLAEMMAITDEWLAAETREGRIAPLEVTLDTVPVEAPSPKQEKTALLKPALIALPHCELAARNLVVVVRVALKSMPSAAERVALSQSLCARIKAGEQAPRKAPALELVTPLRTERDGLALALTGDFNVPQSMLPTVKQLRADHFKRASEVMARSSQRFAKEHPGVTLRRITGLGANAVRFYMDGPLGGFDLLTEVVVAEGAKQPGEVALKDALYRDWQAAGLPVQVGLHMLIPKAHSN